MKTSEQGDTSKYTSHHISILNLGFNHFIINDLGVFLILSYFL